MGAESERVAGFGRLEDGLRQAGDWYRWGPYVSEQDRAGRLLCGKDLSLPGHPDILVTGDLMCLDKLPGVAEVAMQSGLYAGRRITQLAQGQAL